MKKGMPAINNNLTSEALLIGHKTQQSVEGHLLDRLRGGFAKLATDVKPLGMGVDAELDWLAESFGKSSFARAGFR